MRRRDSVFAALLLAAGPANAQNDRVLRGAVPSWVVPSELMPVPEGASGLLFVRRNDTLVHLDEQGQATYLGYRIRILHQNALQLGNLAIAWNPAAGPATVHAVRVYRDGAVTDVLESSQFEILRREDQLEAASLNGILTAVLRVPDLRVGDELELGLTIRSRDPTLGTNEAGLLILNPVPAPGRFRLGLSWNGDQEPNVRMTPDLAAVARRGDRAVTLDFDNPPPAAPPNDAPPRYRWQRIVEYSDFSDWAAISRHFAPLYARAATLGAGSPLRQEAARIAAAHSTPIDRAKAALKLVQQEVRYIYVGLNGGNYAPASAEETWQRRYGDCKGKTALLLALLAALGIEAEPVVVNNEGSDDGLDARLPSPHMFDHVLVRARINGSDYWMDGTLPPVAAPGLAPVMPYRWILPLTERGSTLQNLPWRAPATPNEITLHEIDARAGFDQPARITHTTLVRGIGGLQQQVQFSALTQAQLLASLRQQLVGAVWRTIDDAHWRYDLEAGASVLTIRGTMTVEWENDSGGAKELSLPGGGFSPPERRVRPADQPQDVPYYNEPSFICHVTTVRLPESTRASQWSFNSGLNTRMFGRNYYRAFELREGAISMVRGSRIEQREVDAESVGRDSGRVGSFDNSMARIRYMPSRTGPSAQASGRVPATYEIDWTAADVPCLSAATAR